MKKNKKKTDFMHSIPKRILWTNVIAILLFILFTVIKAVTIGVDASDAPYLVFLLVIALYDLVIWLYFKNNPNAAKKYYSKPFFRKKETSSSAPPKDTRTLLSRPNEKLTTGFYLFLAFFVPFILMFIAFALAKVHPFGDNQILATDLWHQYYPFLVDYHSKLTGGGSLLWTWKSGGGTNYPALLAYYAASPLNLLSVFFPAEALRDFVYYITCVKIGLAGLFFALFLRITFKRRDASIAAFGIMYALCAFVMGYYWNIIWLDTIALLPLVVAGTIALLREGKFRLYILTLALSIITNYYISLFTCIFIALVSIGYTIVEWKSWRKTLRDFFKMAGCTIVSFMISAALVLPVYFALQTTHSSDNTFPTAFATNYYIATPANFGGVLEGVGKTIGNSVAFVEPTAKEGLPNVYCGVFTVFLAILFLFCSKIKLRERLYCLGLLVFFMLSFVIKQLDYVWHGFHFPNQLPFRFSFLFCFVVIYMAFRVFSHIDSIRPVAVIAGICGFVIYLGIAHRYYTEASGSWVTHLSSLFAATTEENNPDPVLLSGFFGLWMAAWVLLYSFRPLLNRLVQAILSAIIGVASTVFVVIHIAAFAAPLTKNESTGTANQSNTTADNGTTAITIAFIVVMVLVIIAVFIALYSKGLNRDNRSLRAMLSVVLLILALVEGAYSSAVGVATVRVTDRKWYPLGTDDTLAMVNLINEREADTVDIYRSEVARYYTLNDPTLIGINGISMFSSMANRNITDYMEKFGVCGWIACNRYTYQESSPFTNMMLNIKYLISPNSNPDSAYRDTTNLNQVAFQNFASLMENKYYLPMGFMVSDDLLNYNVDTLPATDPISNQNHFFRLATGLNGNLYEPVNSTSSGTSVNATAPYDGIAVAYCTASDRSAYDVTVTKTHEVMATNPETGEEYVRSTEKNSEKANIQRPFIMMVGTVKAGDALTVSAGTGSISGRFAMFNENLFLSAYQQFKTSTLQATKATQDSLSGYINVQKDGLFYTSIPAINGWQAYVDGEKVDITPVGNAMLAFKLSKGEHFIELRFVPTGLIPGLIVTGLGILIFIAMILLSWKKINLLDKVLVRAGAPLDAAKGSSAADSEPSVGKNIAKAGKAKFFSRDKSVKPALSGAEKPAKMKNSSGVQNNTDVCAAPESVKTPDSSDSVPDSLSEENTEE